MGLIRTLKIVDRKFAMCFQNKIGSACQNCQNFTVILLISLTNIELYKVMQPSTLTPFFTFFSFCFVQSHFLFRLQVTHLRRCLRFPLFLKFIGNPIGIPAEFPQEI